MYPLDAMVHHCPYFVSMSATEEQVGTHIDQLMELAMSKLTEALDTRDIRKGISRTLREALVSSRTQEAEALAWAVQKLGTPEHHTELQERFAWICERHELYLADEREAKLRRKARREETRR